MSIPCRLAPPPAMAALVMALVTWMPSNATAKGCRVIEADRSGCAPAAAQSTARATARARRLVYQGRDRGPEQTERFTRRVKLARNGSVTLNNIAGEIAVTGGSAGEVSIEAVKRTHGGRGDLESVAIDVTESAGRVDVNTRHTANNDHVRVDYTIAMPESASLDVRAISGNIKITGVHGTVRAEAVSGGISTSGTPRLERIKAVSGIIDLSDAGSDGDLRVETVSGKIHASGLRSRGLDISAVSGSIVLTNTSCERLNAHSFSGGVEYAGALAKNGRYEIHSFSGFVRLVLPETVGFELDASAFHGSIQSDLPLTIRGTSESGRRHGPMQRALHGTFGDGSAVIKAQTFSGSITIAKQ